EGRKPPHRLPDAAVPRARRETGPSGGGALRATRRPRPGRAPARGSIAVLRRPGARTGAAGAATGRGGGPRRARGPRVGEDAAALLAQARAAFTPDSNASTSAVTGAVTMLAAGSSNGARASCFVPRDGKTGESR